ncbi:MAG TPA: RluA family pseudouridine synthase [Gammaproteobacteria bacterium]|jgi:23S rRNA pseudouridine955/2504/2580 synthase|nr:RluA family pseudouridine synthase [Gammaproteobacteria bacterium]HIO42486.1 RluA family pseudouridine synthase [Gammaproteobacteria bacterium]
MIKISTSKYLNVSSYIVDEEYEDVRLDNCLISRLKNLPRSKIYSIIRKGEVRVNGSRSKPDRRLKKDDVIRIPPYRIEERNQNRASKSLTELLEERIIYNKNSVLILNKPEGLASHGGSGLKLGLIEAVRQIDDKFKNAQLVHRLDRGTSGCIVLSLKRSVLRTLNTEMREGRVEKKYLAIVGSKWPHKEIQITSNLKKNHLRSGERHVIETPDGKQSITKFKRLKSNQKVCLLECTLLTGRTHQIRVQVSNEGHPIIGDKKYGQVELNNFYSKRGIKRMLLHAKEINFPEIDIFCSAEEPLLFKEILSNDGT